MAITRNKSKQRTKSAIGQTQPRSKFETSPTILRAGTPEPMLKPIKLEPSASLDIPVSSPRSGTPEPTPRPATASARVNVKLEYPSMPALGPRSGTPEPRLRSVAVSARMKVKLEERSTSPFKDGTWMSSYHERSPLRQNQQAEIERPAKPSKLANIYKPSVERQERSRRAQREPEMWHRNMPARLHFGDTTLAAAYMSRQIEADPGRTSAITGGDTEGRQSVYPPMWALPELTEEELEEVERYADRAMEEVEMDEGEERYET